MSTFIYWITLLVLFGLSRWLTPWAARWRGWSYPRIARWVDFGLIVVASLVFPLTIGWYGHTVLWMVGFILLFGGSWLVLTRQYVRRK